MDFSYIKLYRELIKKPIWLRSTPEHKAILITLLLSANHDYAEWEWMGQKFKVMPGQFVTSLESIRKKTGKGITIQNVRSCLKRFEKLGFATSKATKSGRLITIVNWDSYQPKKEKATKKPTNEQQRGNKEVTPNKNDKNNRKEIYSRVITYLNKKTDKNFKSNSKVAIEKINARLNDNFLPEDFKTVIDNKVEDFKRGDFKEIYLRPETLFGKKFESYLNQKPLNGTSQSKPETNEEMNNEIREAFL